jgi:tRNA (guanine-N7-)-methyltransferase
MNREELETESNSPLNPAAERILWKPADYFRRAEWGEIFERPAPVELDIGCGDGAFLLAMAARRPDRNFLGTERMLGRVEKVCRHAARQELSNVRVLRLESAWSVKYLLPVASVSVAHISFPDPWPKRHHQPRRLIQDEFLVTMRSALAEGGELRLKTDDLPYFQWMEKVIARAAGFERIEWPEDPDYPVTNFEQRFLAQGLPIYRARLRKV